MDLRRGSPMPAYLGALAGNEFVHGAEELRDGERLAQESRRAEPIQLLKRRFVRRAHDDRRRRIALLHASHPRTCEAACVRTQAHEVGDHQIGNRVSWRAIQSINERELIALIAQHLTDEVSYVAVVLDDQDLSYVPQAADFARAMQF